MVVHPKISSKIKKKNHSIQVENTSASRSKHKMQICLRILSIYIFFKVLGYFVFCNAWLLPKPLLLCHTQVKPCKREQFSKLWTKLALGLEIINQLLSSFCHELDEILPEFVKALDIYRLSWLSHLCNNDRTLWWFSTRRTTGCSLTSVS